MSKYRRAAKVDANQVQIVKELRQIPGITVVPGHDDILVGYQGRTYWFEVKNPNTVGKDGEVRKSAIKESQKKLRENFSGHYEVVWDIRQILRAIRVR